MAETIEYNLNINPGNSAGSLKALSKELREIDKLMQQAHLEGNTKAYEALKQKYVDTKEAAKDLREQLQPMEVHMKTLTGTLGGLTNMGAGLATVFGADSKSAEELFKAFAKAQALGQVINGFNQLIADGPKVGAAMKDVGAAMKSAFVANPITMVIAAVAALAIAITAVVVAYQDVYDAESAWNERALKNIEALKTATEEYTNLLKEHALRVRDWNERDLTEGQKAKKRFQEQTDAQKAVIKNTIVQLQLKEKMIAAALEEAKANAEILKWTDPQKYAIAEKGIADLEKRHQDIVVAIKDGVNNYKIFVKESEEAANKIEKETDFIKKQEELRKKNNNQTSKSTKLTNEEKEAIKRLNEEYRIFVEQQKWLNNYREEQLQKEKDSVENIKQLKINLMGEGLEKEQAQLDLEMENRLKIVEYGSEEEYLINEEWKKRTAELNDKYNTQELEKSKKTLEEKIKLYQNYAIGYGEILGLMAVSDKEQRKQSVINLIDMLFNQLKAFGAEKIGEAVLGSFATPDSIATAGASGAIRAGIMTGIMTAALTAFQTMIKSSISGSFAQGGVIPGVFDGSDNQLVRAMPGEVIINRNASQRYAPILNAINQSTGGASIGSNASIIDYDLLASKINDKKVILVTSDVTSSQRQQEKTRKRAILK